VAPGADSNRSRRPQGLISSDGRVRRFNVAFAGVNQSFLFPKAHTCFNRVDLPIYNSKDVMAEYLKLVCASPIPKRPPMESR
jgi:hypothetical protein